MICKDNCEVLGKEYVCDMVKCQCEYKPKKDFSCFDNTISGDFFSPGNNSYNPAAHMCKDDCKRAGEIVGGEWECNMKTCTCEPKAIKCAANTFDVIVEGTSSFSWLNLCVDNCDKLGEGYTCDPFKCVCRKKPGDKVYCDANTIDAYVSDSYGGAQTARFDGSSQICIDNCEKRFGDGYKCDMVSCYCVPEEGEDVSCAIHTDHVSVTDVNKFNASSMQCLDDCLEYYGSNYVCNLGSCTCTKKSSVSCALNTQVPNVPGNLYTPGAICEDDCKRVYGERYVCDAEGCYCKSTAVITPRCGDGYVSTPNVPGGGNEECDVGKGNPDTCVSPEYCNPETCQCEGEDVIIEAICGDGVLQGLEDCDWGSADTNKCPQTEGAAYKYCTEKCECKTIEHTPRCGDGKITPPEGCDGGNVKTNICPEGYSCYTPECICRPLTGSGQCGDGTVTPPEECDHGNTYTEQCPGGLYCENCACVSYTETSHKECDYAHEECIDVVGPGDDECFSDSQCEVEVTPECGNNEREGSEQCDGTDDSLCDADEFCSNDCRCVGETVTLYCGDGVINLNEECESDSDCNMDAGEICSNCQCVGPPEVDCSSWCAEQGYSSVVRGTFPDGQACLAATGEDEEMCKVKCIYAGFGSWSNPAGTTSCCCKHKYVEDCPRTPTGGCDCPDEEYVDNVLCPSHAP
jgi:hypothetical protein